MRTTFDDKTAVPLAKTGWPPSLLQDDCRDLSRWLASRLDAMKCAREAAAAIRARGQA